MSYKCPIRDVKKAEIRVEISLCQVPELVKNWLNKTELVKKQSILNKKCLTSTKPQSVEVIESTTNRVHTVSGLPCKEVNLNGGVCAVDAEVLGDGTGNTAYMSV